METGGAAAVELAVEAALERGGRILPCGNCAAPVLGKYCGECGQAVDTHRRSVIHLLHDLLTDIVSFDSRVLRTIRALFLQPGELPAAFREGRTQRYVPPIRLYLFVSLIFFLFLSVTNIAIVQLEVGPPTGHHPAASKLSASEKPEEPADPDGSPPASGNLDWKIHFFTHAMTARPQLAAGVRQAIDHDKAFVAKASSPDNTRRLIGMLETVASEPAAINKPLTDWLPRILFILLPGFASVLALFYWRQRKGFFFVDHMVFSLSIHSFMFAAILIAICLAQTLDRTHMLLAVLGAIWLYLILAMRRFYRQGWGMTIAKFFLVSAMYGTVFLLPAVTAIFAVSLMDLWRQ
ncbi:MAG TPA: DUF3667 domain-containing protein [Rhizomicrobium sp.]|nr:DUF3667 domain-containing protein [Rhizomicrobium sp.]